MPRPYRTPYLPGLTALIPHFEEPILLQPEDLFSEAWGGRFGFRSSVFDWQAPGEQRDLGHLIDYLRIKYAPSSHLCSACSTLIATGYVAF